MSVLAAFYQQMNEQIQASFGGEERARIGLDATGFLMDMPLVDLLHFMGGALQISPEEMVDELLAKAHSIP